MQLFNWALILLSLPIQAVFAATPQNPLLVDQGIYLSNNGIHKFNQFSLEQQWSSLNGIQTFEPVMGEQLLYVGTSQGLYELNPGNG